MLESHSSKGFPSVPGEGALHPGEASSTVSLYLPPFLPLRRRNGGQTFLTFLHRLRAFTQVQKKVRGWEILCGNKCGGDSRGQGMESQEGERRCVRGQCNRLSADVGSGTGTKEWAGFALWFLALGQTCVSTLTLYRALNFYVCQHSGVHFRHRRGSCLSQQKKF